MYESLSQIILFSSILGMGIILFKKIPVLVLLPEQNKESISFKRNFLNIEKKVKKLHLIKFNYFEKFLVNSFSKSKTLISKTDEPIKKNKQKNNLSDNYWGKIKNQK